MSSFTFSVLWVRALCSGQSKSKTFSGGCGYAWTNSCSSESRFGIFLKIPSLGLLLWWEVWGRWIWMVLERLFKISGCFLKTELWNQNFRGGTERWIPSPWSGWVGHEAAEPFAQHWAGCDYDPPSVLNSCPHTLYEPQCKEVGQYYSKGYGSALEIWDEVKYCCPKESGFWVINSRNLFQLICPTSELSGALHVKFIVRLI